MNSLVAQTADTVLLVVSQFFVWFWRATVSWCSRITGESRLVLIIESFCFGQGLRPAVTILLGYCDPEMNW